MLISLYGVPGCLLPCNMEWIISSGAQIPSKLVHVFPFTEFFSQLTLNPGLVPRHRMHCRGFQSRNVMWLQTGTSAECLCNWQNPGQSLLAFAYAAQASSRASQSSGQQRQLLIFSSTAAHIHTWKQYCSSCRHLPLSLFCAIQHIWGSKSTSEGWRRFQ